MANTTAQASRTILFVKGVGSYAVNLKVSTGNLFQRYRKDGSKLIFMPDFATSDTKPTVEAEVMDTQTGKILPASRLSVMWYVGENLIEFNASSTSTGPTGWAGVVEHLESNKIQFVGNLADKLPHNSYLKAVVTVTLGASSTETTTTTVQTPIELIDSATQDYYISIYGPVGLTLKRGLQQITLSALAFGPESKLDPVTGPSTNSATCWIQWSKYDPGDNEWKDAGKTPTITVEADDVDAMATYRAALMMGVGEKAFDTETVVDHSDPYWIQPNPNFADEVIYDECYDDPTVTDPKKKRDHLTYTPKLMKGAIGEVGADADAQVVPNKTFNFVLLDPSGRDSGNAGTIVRQATDATEFRIDRGVIADLSTNPQLIITTTI